MKIRGNTVGTPMKRPDFNQPDPKKSDFIKNNPIPKITEEDEGKVLIVDGGKFVLAEQTNEKLELDLTNLKAITIGNTWVLDIDKIKAKGSFVKRFNFVSNGMAFKEMSYSFDVIDGKEYHYLSYLHSATDEWHDAYQDGWVLNLHINTWLDDAFKTIRTPDDIDLGDIATKVESTNDLETAAKTFIDAINEVNRGIKFVPAYYKEPVVDEDGNEVEEGGWFWDKWKENEIWQFGEKVLINKITGGESKLVLFDLSEFLEGKPVRILSPDIKVFESVDSAIDFFDQFIAATWKRLPEEAQEAIRTFINNAYQSIIDTLQKGYDAIVGWFGGLPEEVKNFPAQAQAKIEEVLNAIFKTYIQTPAENFWTWLTTQLENLRIAAENGINELYNTVKTDIENAINDFKQRVTDAIEKALQDLNAKVTELTTFINETIKTGLDEAQEWIEDVGKVVTKKVDDLFEFFGGDLIPDSNFAEITENSYTTFVKTNSIDTLNTNDKTVAGGINELHGMLAGNTWVLDEAKIKANGNFIKNFNFVSNGITFKEMSYSFEVSDGEEYHYLAYLDTIEGRYHDAYYNGWVDDAFKTIFTYDTSISLKNIAENVTLKRPDLNTTDKTIVGAINEVNSNATTMLQNLTDGSTKVGSAELADGITNQENLETKNKTIVGAINEIKRAFLSGNVADLTDTTWDLSNIGERTKSRGTYNIDFISNGTKFNSLKFTIGFSEDGSSFKLSYGSRAAYTDTQGWMNTEYPYITITGGSDASSITLINDLLSFATLREGGELPPYQTKEDKALETESKEIVGAINELNAKIGEGGSTDDIVGTWILNETLDITLDGVYEVPIEASDGAGTHQYIGLYFLDNEIMGALISLPNDYTEIYEAGDWFKNREVTFLAPTNNAELDAWVMANGKKKATDTGNYISKYVVELSGSETVADIINKLTTTYPDYQLGVWGIVEFTGATSGLYGLTINHYGGNVYNISGADFGTFYTMSNNVTDWSTVSLWSFTSMFQPPIPICDNTNEGQVLMVVGGVPTWV